MGFLRVLSRTYFGTELLPRHIDRIETADLDSGNGSFHYYTAQREKDGFFRITHNQHRGPGARVGNDTLMIKRFQRPYDLDEALYILGLMDIKPRYSGPEKSGSQRMFNSLFRPHDLRDKLESGHTNPYLDEVYAIHGDNLLAEMDSTWEGAESFQKFLMKYGRAETKPVPQ